MVDKYATFELNSPEFEAVGFKFALCTHRDYYGFLQALRQKKKASFYLGRADGEYREVHINTLRECRQIFQRKTSVDQRQGTSRGTMFINNCLFFFRDKAA